MAHITRPVAPVWAVMALLATSGCQLSIFLSDDDLYDDRRDAFGSMLTRQTAIAPTPPASMPAGTADYAGYVELATPSDVAIGVMNATVDFGTPAITGSVSNVISDDRGRLGGVLAITNGDVVSNTFSADLDGTLKNGVFSTTYDTAVSGTFRGPSANGMLGSVTGSATSGTRVEPVTGWIVGE